MVTTLALALSMVAPTSADMAKNIYPFSPLKPSPDIVIDVKTFPQGKAWAEKARDLMVAWYPNICQLLDTKDYKGYKKITLAIEPKISAPAWAAGDRITCSGEWITQHPEDFGMVIHELTHVIQSYPGSEKTPGWLVEGIADYVRWFRFEPEGPRPKIDYTKSKYTDAYRTTAYFLAWVTSKYDRRIVPMLDGKMRKAEDPIPVFKELSGKTPDELWTEFIASKP
ncbi:MAG: hypothetical protein JST40_13165 [Armatimonadetes bacterium]|nr:hypothetical protein [Armatimonadota bacterium]